MLARPLVALALAAAGTGCSSEADALADESRVTQTCTETAMSELSPTPTGGVLSDSRLRPLGDGRYEVTGDLLVDDVPVGSFTCRAFVGGPDRTQLGVTSLTVEQHGGPGVGARG